MPLPTIARTATSYGTALLELTIPDEDWEQQGWSAPDDGTAADEVTLQIGADRLCCRLLLLNGVGLHLWAGRAWVDPADDCVKFRNADMERELMPALQTIWEGAYQLTTIRGDTYIVYATAHAN